VVALAIAGLLAWGAAATLTAFDHVWSVVGCSNVGSGEYGFWDDSPGGGRDNETALFWIRTNSIASERCTAGAAPGVSTNLYPKLKVRLAVNDGAVVRIEAKEGSEFCGGGTAFATLTTGATQDHSGFFTKTISLPPGHTVSELCVTIDDDPDGVGSPAQPVTALIDHIQIWNAATGSIGWQESFTGGRP
jgi:hypothetical protein